MRAVAFAAFWLSWQAWGGEGPLDLSTTRPATFLINEGDFRPHIQFPPGVDEDADKKITVLCSAGVTSRGVLQFVYCLNPPEQPRAYERAVLQGMKSGRLAPALVNGRRHRVLVSMVVEFDRSNGQREIRVRLNDGQAASIHGPEYIGPQAHSIPRIPSSCYRFEGLLIAQGIVGTDGKMREVAFNRPIEDEACIDRFRSHLAGTQYIPARKDDEWVWSTSIEFFIGRESDVMRVR